MSELYPCRLIGSRLDTGGPYHPPQPVVWVDTIILRNEAQHLARLAEYTNLEALGAMSYDKIQPIPLGSVKETVARLRLELEQQLAELVEPDPFQLALDEAVKLATAHYREAGDWKALDRLPRAALIARCPSLWEPVEDEAKSLRVYSQSEPSKSYITNGRCTCPDFEYRGGPCKHQLCRYLVLRASKLMLDGKKNGEPSGTNTQPPDGQKEHPHDSTAPVAVQTITLTVGYEASSSGSLPIINAGTLMAYLEDGEPGVPASEDLDVLYRWLADNDYKPAGFRWAGYVAGLRHRTQTYELATADTSTALPVEQATRGRSKLFKGVR